MKKHVLKTSLLAGIAALLFTFSDLRGGSLTDITKPYLGEYECKSATLGGTDYTDEFSYIVIELKPDDSFVLRYQTKEKVKGSETGTYKYDKEKESICLSVGENGEIKRQFPLKDGTICLTFRVGAKMLTMKFEQK